MELLVPYKGPDREDPAFHILVRWCNTGVCQVFCVSFKKIFWGGEPPHLYHPTLLNDTLLKCFGNISNRVSCQ